MKKKWRQNFNESMGNVKSVDNENNWGRGEGWMVTIKWWQKLIKPEVANLAAICSQSNKKKCVDLEKQLIINNDGGEFDWMVGENKNSCIQRQSYKFLRQIRSNIIN